MKRRRLLATVILCLVTSALWISAPVLPSLLFGLPRQPITPLLVLVGLALPAEVGGLTLMFMERRIVRDLKPAEPHEWGQVDPDGRMRELVRR
jgi:hypothetical protein